MVAIAGLVILVASVPLYGALGVWIEALGRQFEWTPDQLRGSVIIAGYLLLGLLVGYLSDRFGPRRIVVAGLFILAGAWLFFGLAQNLWMYYGAFVFIAAGGFLSGTIPLMTILCRWFVRRRATAIAAASLVAPIGAAAVVPFIAWSADPDSGGAGWQFTALVVSGCVLIVAALAFARLRNRPGDMGLLADGDTPAQQSSYSTAQALLSRSFWLIVVGEALASSSVLTSHLFFIARDAGLTSAHSQIFGSIQSTVAIVFYLAGGLAGDRVAKHKAMALFTLLQVAGFAMLTVASSLPAFYLAGALLGMGTGGRLPLNVATLADYFGLDSFGKILAFSILFSGLLAGFSGPLVVWRLYVTQGGYLIPILALAGMSLLGAFLFLKARPPQPPGAAAPQAAPG